MDLSNDLMQPYFTQNLQLILIVGSLSWTGLLSYHQIARDSFLKQSFPSFFNLLFFFNQRTNYFTGFHRSQWDSLALCSQSLRIHPRRADTANGITVFAFKWSTSVFRAFMFLYFEVILYLNNKFYIIISHTLNIMHLQKDKYELYNWSLICICFMYFSRFNSVVSTSSKENCNLGQFIMLTKLTGFTMCSCMY